MLTFCKWNIRSWPVHTVVRSSGTFLPTSRNIEIHIFGWKLNVWLTSETVGYYWIWNFIKSKFHFFNIGRHDSLIDANEVLFFKIFQLFFKVEGPWVLHKQFLWLTPLFYIMHAYIPYRGTWDPTNIKICKMNHDTQYFQSIHSNVLLSGRM